MTQQPLWRVGLAMLAAMTLITAGDTAAKLLSARGLNPIFTAWTRFALGALMVLPFCGLRWADRAALRAPLIWLRALMITCAISSILTALRTEPIADAFGAFFIGPVVAYILSALVLRERITPLRSILLGLSFLGVLMVVKPGFGATLGMGFALLAGCLHGCYVVTTRATAGRFRPTLLLLSQLALGAMLLSPFGLQNLPDGQAIWSGMAIALILISAAGSALGNLLLVQISAHTPSSIIAPLIYTQLLSTTLFGWMFFSDWPDGWSFVGLALIMATGLGSLALARR